MWQAEFGMLHEKKNSYQHFMVLRCLLICSNGFVYCWWGSSFGSFEFYIIWFFSSVYCIKKWVAHSVCFAEKREINYRNMQLKLWTLERRTKPNVRTCYEKWLFHSMWIKVNHKTKHRWLAFTWMNEKCVYVCEYGWKIKNWNGEKRKSQ